MKYCNGRAYSDLKSSELEPIVNYCEYVKQRDKKKYSTEKAFIDLCKLYDEVKDYMMSNGADIEDLSMITFDALFSGIKDGFDADKISSLLMLSKITCDRCKKPCGNGTYYTIDITGHDMNPEGTWGSCETVSHNLSKGLREAFGNKKIYCKDCKDKIEAFMSYNYEGIAVDIAR